jgi:hypothetical protein
MTRSRWKGPKKMKEARHDLNGRFNCFILQELHELN